MGGKFAEALSDVEHALGSRPDNHMALHWKGIVLFYMGDFNNAKLAFEAALRSKPGNKSRELWVRKCDSELSGSTLPLGGVAVGTSKTVPPPAGSTTVNAPVDCTENTESLAAVGAGTPARPAETTSAKTGLNVSGHQQYRREWYQNNTHVYITIFVKNISREQCEIAFEEDGFSLTIRSSEDADKEYQLNLELSDAIKPDECKLEVSKVKVEVILAKKNLVQWRDLEKRDDAIPDVSPSQPAYPTSAKQKRDWGQIDSEMERELKAQKPEGEEALNTLFREIYGKADDETRRAMNKSFQTSGGTVLSTNWGEVGKADYEGKDRPSAPDGQEWRDWKNK